ncbi:MAG: winged helix-turn-helix domain-containing protein [Anaerolineae bacterium]|nr:winged helix-turn-helix domain-containing protein [Anaerolineae bacterium]
MTSIARLVVRAGMGRVGQEILLADDVTTLGRAATCQVVIDNDFASRRHAQIIRRDELFWLRDLDSKNGTLLDNEPVTAETPLADGAEIRIGAVILRFVDPAATRTQPNLAAVETLLRMDSSARQVWLHGEILTPPLTAKQFDLLLYLYQRAGEAVSKDELAAAVWPEDQSEAVYDYQVDKMVSRVRERIGKEWIETVWGYGYRLRRE